MGQTKPSVPASGHNVETGGLPIVAEHGVVYTRPWVVNLILDLAGYDPDRNLVDLVAIEPSCGDGEFLEQIIRRLSSSCRRQGRPL